MSLMNAACCCIGHCCVTDEFGGQCGCYANQSKTQCDTLNGRWYSGKLCDDNFTCLGMCCIFDADGNFKDCKGAMNECDCLEQREIGDTIKMVFFGDAENENCDLCQETPCAEENVTDKIWVWMSGFRFTDRSATFYGGCEDCAYIEERDATFIYRFAKCFLVTETAEMAAYIAAVEAYENSFISTFTGTGTCPAVLYENVTVEMTWHTVPVCCNQTIYLWFKPHMTKVRVGCTSTSIDHPWTNIGSFYNTDTCPNPSSPC